MPTKNDSTSEIIPVVFIFLCTVIGVLVWKKGWIDCFRNKFNDYNYPILMLLGAPGVGKTQIIQQIGKYFNEKIIQSPDIQEFCHVNVRANNITIADTPGLDFDSDIDAREKQITSFKKYFTQSLNKVSALAIVVNFERTDLMLKKVSDVYKYFRSFDCDLLIIVTDWQLSENPQDKVDLECRFSLFKPKSIVYLKRHEATQDLWEKLSCLDLRIHRQINLKDTMFEEIDQQQMNYGLNQLAIRVQGSNQPLISNAERQQLH